MNIVKRFAYVLAHCERTQPKSSDFDIHPKGKKILDFKIYFKYRLVTAGR